MLAQHPRVPTDSPQGINPEFLRQFRLVDADGSGTITAIELQTALKGGEWPPFEVDTVKLLMSLFDIDRNGTIDINEFDGLWKYIESWQGVFGYFDKNKSNTIDGDELEQALKQYGYRDDLTTDLQELLKRKYGDPAAASPAGGSEPGITFDRFMRACVVVKQLKELFDVLEKDSEDRVKINYETFLEMVFKLP
ncbi:hypothetical protein BGY98DRAFT_1069957 [Russula aff. rugulosa BPL654]|nr:hypothetical protein BGY98DRAFT_1069957 [Russula aff. rugulosa BPL654]